MEQEKPIYLVIEGIDGAGKETQTRLLKEYLKSLGKNVITQSFPTILNIFLNLHHYEFSHPGGAYYY